MKDDRQTSENLERMICTLKEKHHILRDLMRFTVLQKEMLTAGGEVDLDVFTVLLTERGRLMEDSDRLDEDFLKDFAGLKLTLGCESLENLPPGILPRESARTLQEQVGQIKELLQAIQQLDGENRDKMKEHMDSLRGEISRVQQGKKAIHGYANTRQQQPSLFMDEKEKDFSRNRDKK